ncbi:MAG: ADP-ribosylglycohydrolase family protein [Candidatus Hodarchaeota archaeon]
MDEEILRSKFLGCMIGSAIGDALGRPREGSGISETEDLEFEGRYTDDTEMMIGIAESLIEKRGFDGEHMAQTFIRNFDPTRGYGFGPPRVFNLIISGEKWNKASMSLFGGSGSFGNGASMRIAPIGLLYHKDFRRMRSVAYSSSQITHSHELGKEGAALQAFAVALALEKAPPSLDRLSVLNKLKELIIDPIYQQKLEGIQNLLSRTPHKKGVIKELGNGIEAFNSVPTAIYSFLSHLNSFKSAVTYAVSLGGDADTIGAMTGAIAGAYHGLQDIPVGWFSKLENGAYIKTLAESLWRLKQQR